MAETATCGAVAAGLSICVTNPFDVVKSRFQVQGELGSGKQVYSGPIGAVAAIARKEGISGLYRGLPPAVLFQMSGNFFRFGVYHWGKGAAGAANDSYLRNIGLGMLSGVSAAAACCPFFVLKTQMQIQTSAAELATGHQHAYSSIVDAARHIYKDEGLRGFYRGIDAFMLRTVVLVAAQMPSYDAAKHALVERFGFANAPPAHFISSAIAAGCACVCMQPFDLVACRLMNQPAGAEQMYSGPIDCLRKTVRAEGFLGLYKGVSANYLRMGPQYILTFIFFEQLKSALHRFRSGQ